MTGRREEVVNALCESCEDRRPARANANTKEAVAASRR